MTINLQKPDITELKPRITVYGVGGGGGNAVNNMIMGGLEGVEFVVANTDAQALSMSKAERIVQMGTVVTEGLGAGSQPEIGRAAAEECLTEITDYLSGTHMAFITAGMGGGTGTGAAPVVARAAREMGILTVGVVTKPFHFEGRRRMLIADSGIEELQKNVDTLIVIPNQNLFRIANDKTTFADAFGMADQVLYSGVACITDLMVKEGLINLDFADVRSVMNEMGKAMMGTGEASGDGRAIQAAEAAISNPLLDESSMLGAQGLLISITGGRDMTLFEVDEAATRIREEVDEDANIILGATFDEDLEGTIRVSVVATGIDHAVTNEQNDTSVNTKVSSLAKSVPTNGASGLQSNNTTLNKTSSTATSSASDTPSQNKHKDTNPGKISAAVAKPALKTPAVEKNGVRIEPFQPQNDAMDDFTVDEEFRNALELELMPKDSNYIPPSAEKVDDGVSTPMIPDVSDFPPIAQAELKADKTQSAASEERGPMGLLRKLKSGFATQEEDVKAQPAATAPLAPAKPDQSAIQPQPANVKPTVRMQGAPNLSEKTVTSAAPSAPAMPANRPMRPQSSTPAQPPAGQPPVSPYAPKRGALDQNGRIVAQPKQTSEEEQLDIPAFLRRQSN